MPYITKDANGKINSVSSFAATDNEFVNYELERGWDEYFYKKGEAPAKPSPTREDQLAALKSSYDIKLAALDLSLQNALWVDGTQEEATRAALSAKRTALLRERSAAIKALTGK